MEFDRLQMLGRTEHGLAVAVTTRADGSAQASVVNAGVLDHPVSGTRVVGFVARGGAKKLTNLRQRPRVTLVFRSGWDWAAVEGEAELAGPHDRLAGFDSSDTSQLLREIYSAAVGGTPDEWRQLDDVMADKGHTAVLVRVRRMYPNPTEGRSA